MAPGNMLPPSRKRGLVKIPTTKLIPAIIFMYQSEDKKVIKSALDLAAYIMESYDDADAMRKDIFSAFVIKKSMIAAMKIEVERKFPIEAKSLKNIFGEFLFGG